MLPKRYWDKVVKHYEDESGCWEWVGGPYDVSKFGLFRMDEKTQSAHRLSYLALKGPIDGDNVVYQTCCNRRCVNPDHLEQITLTETRKRQGAGKYNRSKTHCPQGHSYDESNTRVYGPSDWRVCKACARESSRRAARKRWLTKNS